LSPGNSGFDLKGGGGEAEDGDRQEQGEHHTTHLNMGWLYAASTLLASKLYGADTDVSTTLAILYYHVVACYGINYFIL
jgi:hypothetical protein